MPGLETRIQTIVNGLDNIEIRAVLLDGLAVDQLEAVKKIADNGTLIAQQRFSLEQDKINQEVALEYLRTAKGFVLWGFLVSIPFLFISYWIFKSVFSGYRSSHSASGESFVPDFAAQNPRAAGRHKSH